MKQNKKPPCLAEHTLFASSSPALLTSSPHPACTYKVRPGSSLAALTKGGLPVEAHERLELSTLRLTAARSTY